MADANTTVAQVKEPTFPILGDIDYFTYAGIFSAMAASVRKHDPNLFKQCAGAIDMSHTCTLRGLGYLGKLLSDDNDADDRQRSIAGETIAEFTALVAVLLEIQNDGAFMERFGPLSVTANEVSA